MTTRRRVLRTECHLHLYGCLTTEDLYQRGLELDLMSPNPRNSPVIQRLDAWVESTRLHWGHTPDWRVFWNKPRADGLAALRDAYELTTPCRFAAFDAKLALTIALFPILPDAAANHDSLHAIDLPLRRVVSRHAREGLFAAEYRVFVARLTDPSFFDHYITTLALAAHHLNGEHAPAFHPRLALSISRDPAIATVQYKQIREWQAQNPSLAPFVTGIDFCGPEESHPPELLAPLITQIVDDNRRLASPRLSVLYHVGETFESRPQTQAVQWIRDVAALDQRSGSIRLGHASALGISNSDSPELTRLQHEVARFLKSDAPEVVIETCPTSNRLLGGINGDPRRLPCGAFHDLDLPIVVSSDDPGVFARDLAAEENLCRHAFDWAHDYLETLEARARRSLNVPPKSF